MKASDIPTKFQVAFAASASGANVRPIPLTTIDPTAASQQLGFPPETFTPLDAGGVAPDGRDMNGVLNMATAWDRWMSAGAPVPYDGAFSSTIGGYPAGTVLAAATLGQFWLSTADDNTSNPDTGGANWALSTSSNFYALDTGTANTYLGAYIPNFSTPVAGLPLRLKIANTNTGPSTFNGKAVVRRDLSALIGGELVFGQIATLAYLGAATDKYQLQGIAPASNAVTAAGTDTQSAVTPAGLLATFGQSAANPGYIKFPGGLILQWGTTDFGTEEPTAVYGPFNFPTAFPTACLTFSVTTIFGLGDLVAGLNIGNMPTATQYWVYLNQIGATTPATGRGFTWFAIGH